MRSKKFFIFFLLAVCLVSKAQEKKKDPITYLEDRAYMFIPVSFPEADVRTKMIFDLGFNAPWLWLDKGLVVDNPGLLKNVDVSGNTNVGIAWSDNILDNGRYFYGNLKTSICNSIYDFGKVEVWGFRQTFFFDDEIGGLISIPIDDSTHVWELNFENDYISIAETGDFEIPSGSYKIPFKRDEYGHFILALSFTAIDSEGNKMRIRREFMIDSAVHRDILFFPLAEEAKILNERDDAEWRVDGDEYVRFYTMNAEFEEGFSVDSLRLYTFYEKEFMVDALVGLNFLKRFNVFFDLKNSCLYLQPHNNFKRIVSPLKRFYFRIKEREDGICYFKLIPKFKENSILNADIREGDEIYSLNGILFDDITYEQMEEIRELDRWIFIIRRDGELMTKIVEWNTDEPIGD